MSGARFVNNTPGTLFGHSGARGPKGLAGTLWTLSRTPPFSGTLSKTLAGTLWVRSARETPVAGRGVPNFFVCLDSVCLGGLSVEVFTEI